MSCIVSPKPKDKDGYPRCKHQGIMTTVSRIVYSLLYGDIEQGKQVLHTCDNPGCVNPEHLYLGDFHTNMLDKVKRGRVAGDNHPRAKVTEEQIAEMKALYEKGGYSQEKIGELFGISQSQVSAIMNGKRLGTRVFTRDDR